MKQSERNHLRRLVGWIRCEIGQSPAEDAALVRQIAEKLGDPEISDAARQRFVEANDKARSVPAYVRAAVKALEAMLNEPGEVVEGRTRTAERIDP